MLRENVSKGSVPFAGSSYFYYQQPDYPRDCAEAKNQCSTNNLSGVYLIKPEGYPEPFEVYCNNSADAGGWTVRLTYLIAFSTKKFN